MAVSKVALITGGTNGIGKEIARKLLGEGYEVVFVGKDQQKCRDTVKELTESSGNGKVTAIVADLSLMREVKKASGEFLSSHSTLDFLFLGANAFVPKETRTQEGFEWHLALGYLSKALMARQLENVLKSTPGSQILVVGVPVHKGKIHFEDINLEKKFSIISAIMQFQWAIHLFAREYNAHSPVPMNVYQPGLVKTNIIAGMPQPFKFIAKLGYLLKGIAPEKAAENIFRVISDVSANKRKNEFYNVDKPGKSPALDAAPEESERLWQATEKILQPFL